MQRSNSTRLTWTQRTWAFVGIASALLAGFDAFAAKPTEDSGGLLAKLDLDFNAKGLRKRVKQLETDIGELQALNLPVDIAVDCAAGGSVNNVLATHANGLGRLTLRLSGTCNETIVVARSNVAIIGAGPEATTVQAPASNAFGMLVNNAARNVTISGLRLTGGQGAAAVNKNAHAVFSNIIAERTNLGMVAADNGTLEITASILRNNNFGAFCVRHGVILISNGTVENNGTGLLAFKGGLINVTSLDPATATPAGVVVRNNTNGGVARSGGVIELSDSRIEANRAVGLLADSTSALHFFNPFNGTGNVVTGHPSVGVLVQRTASVVFADNTNVITGNNIGVLCQPNSGFIPPVGGLTSVTGNTAGDVVNCVP